MEEQSFKILCDDYLLCSRTLVYWRHSGEAQARERYLEYSELLTSMQEEIENFLEPGQREPKDGSGRLK